MTDAFIGDDPQLRYDSASARHHENRGRRAVVYADFTTTGQGAVEFDKRIGFGLTFVGKPWMAYGCEIDMDDVRDQTDVENDGDVTRLPQSTGYVTEWDTDGAGNYIGAWVAVSVTFTIDMHPHAAISIEHMFTFDGTAIKDVPDGPPDD